LFRLLEDVASLIGYCATTVVREYGRSLNRQPNTHVLFGSAQQSLGCIEKDRPVDQVLLLFGLQRVIAIPNIHRLNMSLPLQHVISLRQHCKVNACQIHLLSHRSLSSAPKSGSLSLLDLCVCEESITKSVNANIDGPSILPDRRYACYTGRKLSRSPGPGWSSQDLPEQPRGYIR